MILQGPIGPAPSTSHEAHELYRLRERAKVQHEPFTKRIFRAVDASNGWSYDVDHIKDGSFEAFKLYVGPSYIGTYDLAEDAAIKIRWCLQGIHHWLLLNTFED